MFFNKNYLNLYHTILYFKNYYFNRINLSSFLDKLSLQEIHWNMYLEWGNNGYSNLTYLSSLFTTNFYTRNWNFFQDLFYSKSQNNFGLLEPLPPF